MLQYYHKRLCSLHGMSGNGVKEEKELNKFGDWRTTLRPTKENLSFLVASVTKGPAEAKGMGKNNDRKHGEMHVHKSRCWVETREIWWRATSSKPQLNLYLWNIFIIGALQCASALSLLSSRLTSVVYAESPVGCIHWNKEEMVWHGFKKTSCNRDK